MRLTQTEPEFQDISALNAVRERNIGTLEDRIRQSEGDFDAHVEERARLGIRMDSQAEALIAAEMERQMELSSLDHELTSLLDEADELQDRIHEQSSVAADMEAVRTDEIGDLLMQLGDIEVSDFVTGI